MLKGKFVQVLYDDMVVVMILRKSGNVFRFWNFWKSIGISLVVCSLVRIPYPEHGGSSVAFHMEVFLGMYPWEVQSGVVTEH